jgi:hypothetical protein
MRISLGSKLRFESDSWLEAVLETVVGALTGVIRAARFKRGIKSVQHVLQLARKTLVPYCIQLPIACYHGETGNYASDDAICHRMAVSIGKSSDDVDALICNVSFRAFFLP